MRRKRIWCFFFFLYTYLRKWKSHKFLRHLCSRIKNRRACGVAAYINRHNFLQDIYFKSLCSCCDIILASGLFQCRCWLSDAFYVKMVCASLGVWMNVSICFDTHYPLCWCEDISSLEVFVSVRFITLIMAIVTHLVKHGCVSFCPSSKKGLWWHPLPSF